MPERILIRYINTDNPVNDAECGRGNSVDLYSRPGNLQGVERVECQSCEGCSFQNGMQNKNLSNIMLTCGVQVKPKIKV